MGMGMGLGFCARCKCTVLYPPKGGYNTVQTSIYKTTTIISTVQVCCTVHTYVIVSHFTVG